MPRLLGAVGVAVGVAVAAVTLIGGIATAGGSPVVFHDPLRQPSAAFRPQRTAGLSISFVEQRLRVASMGSGFVFLPPKFSGNGPQLTAVHVDVDVSLGPTTIAGVFCRGASTRAFYDFVVDTDRTFSINKVSAGNATGLASSTVAAARTYHLRAECSGPGQPGGSGTVQLMFGITTSHESDHAAFSDTGAAYDAGPVGLLVAGTGPHPGVASFSNLTVRQG